MKRYLAALAGATLAAGAVFGSPGAARAVEIEYWQYFFQGRVDAIDALIEKFEAENPGITVRHTHFPYADYRTKVAAAVPAGEGPDVVQLFYGWLNDYIEADLLQPLPTDMFDPAEIESEYFPMVEAMKIEGQYYALPTAVRSLALFWNKRLFEQAGLDPEHPPETLDEMVEYAKALTQRDGGGNLTAVGLTMGMNAQDHHWWREVLVRQMGGAPYSGDNHDVTYDGAAGQRALDFYVGLIEEHGVSQIGFMDQPQAAFKAGRAGMHIDGSFRLGALRGQRGLEWGVTELPANAAGERFNFSSYWVNGITSKAQGERAEAAAKFLAFVTSEEAMQLWLETVGELPARQAAALTPENTAHPEYGPFIRGLEYATATKFVAESAQRQLMVDMVDRILLEGASVEESVRIAAEAEQALLDDFYSAM
ncbi:MAG: extracellular solute-binding protein [Inquilinus sp.]|nr:extracellular solute-binding protein [Inquilinus sp.]